MPRPLFALSLLLALLLQAVALPGLVTVAVRPNLVLVLLLLWTVDRGTREGALWAFGSGLALDLLTVAPLGQHALALLVVVVLGAISRNPGLRLGLLLPMAAAFVSTLAHDTVVLALQDGRAQLLVSLLRLSLLSALLNVVGVPLLVPWVSLLGRWASQIDELAGRPTPPGPASGRSRR